MNKHRYILSFAAILIFTVIARAEYLRVVSLAPSLTKNIYQLQAKDKLVGCTNYCVPAKDEGVQIVASPIAINIEKVLSTKPDLIVATTITTPDNIELLRKFNISVQVFPTPQSFNEICTQFSQLGRLLGKEDHAKKVIGEVRLKVDSIREVCNTKPKHKIFYQIGANPLYTVIPNTFMDDYITYVNCANIASGLTRGTITRESVLNRKPDHIFIVTMGILGNEQKELWLGYKDLPAVGNGAIYIIDSDMACTPTPQTFLQTLQVMYQLMHN